MIKFSFKLVSIKKIKIIININKTKFNILYKISRKIKLTKINKNYSSNNCFKI